MTIEKVRLKRHLACGESNYPVGVYPNPVTPHIPDDILAEVHRGDVVEILEESQPSPPPVSSSETKSVWEKEPPKGEIKTASKAASGRKARKV